MKYFSLSQQWILSSISLFALLLLYLKFFYHPSPPPEPNKHEVVIEIEGEIQKPGIYLFKEPPTLKEAIERAGGFKETIQFTEEFSSERLNTGTQITIEKRSPEQIHIKIGRMGAHQLLVFFIPLNLNQVSFDDLLLIPGIGESLSQEIIAYRQKRKGFRSIEELKEIKGIGEAKFQSIKGYFTVE